MEQAGSGAGQGPNESLHLTGAAMLVLRGMMLFEATPAA
jgi:hypothetical protein